MTHGRTTKTRLNPRSGKRSSPLTRISERPGKSLESRVAKLEARVEQMQEEINQALGGVPAHIREAIDSIGKKHHGPQKKIDDTELLLNRDNLVQWLEEHWPNIVQRFLPRCPTPSTIAEAFGPIAADRDIRPEWQRRFMDHLGVLLDFLQNEKFRRKPPKKTVADALRLVHSERRDRAANRFPTRQIANAMAGVPKLKWRTSLDKCSRNPCANRVGYNTAVHYRTVYHIPEENPNSLR